MSVAVVGSGIAGLSSAWLLARHCDVTLYEAEDRLGGHSNTVDAMCPMGDDVRPVPVDTGFIVYNERNYPNLTALFNHLGVATEPSDMTFSVSVDRGRLEYKGGGRLNGLFAQRRNLARPDFWLMLAEIARFYRTMRAADPAALETVSLGDFVERGGYSGQFRDQHLLPMAAAIWSGTLRSMLEFPAAAFLRFCNNHGLLQLSKRPRWRTVSGGSREYVNRMADEFAGLFGGRIRLSRPVHALRRGADAVTVEADGDVTAYDHVVVAAHGDGALAMLADPSDEERRVLGGFRYQPNRAVLHRDPALMPRRRRAWASWNYLSDRASDPEEPVSVTYWMNRLQNLGDAPPIFLSLNPAAEPRTDLVEREFLYDHPQYDQAAIEAQRRLPVIQGHRRTWFCGSYWGHGFHEDALVSGMAVARALGVEAPWRESSAVPPDRGAEAPRAVPVPQALQAEAAS